jgi:hypothetical protein
MEIGLTAVIRRNWKSDAQARRNTIRNARWEIIGTMEAGFQCAGCGEWNATAVDATAGRRQSYVEDCQVCCKPNILQVEYDTSSQEFFIKAELE